MSKFTQFWDYVFGLNKQGAAATPSIFPYDYTELYQALYDLYNNDDELFTDDTTRRVRTVVNRSVEFYASKMLPGQKVEVLINEDQPEELKTAIEQILKDSNFGNNKPAMLRSFALYGDSFVRVRGDDEKTYLEDVSPFYVTDFDEDSRGFLTSIRIDIPVLASNGTPALYTELWDAETETLSTWTTQMARTTPIDQLGSPTSTMSFAEMGISFIPIVHTKFRDNGDLRGIGCVFHALDKIYEANRMATRLHDLFFRFDKAIWAASANDKDINGRPLPPPQIKTGSGADATTGETTKETVFGDIVYLPGVAKLDALIPGVNYSDGLAILKDHMEELEKDLPELRWYSLQLDTTMSGTALRTLLGAAIDRAVEARNNFISSLQRMVEMALTIGIFKGIFPASLGSFDAGDFDHQLIVEDAWGASTDEKAATMKGLTDAGVPAPAAMKIAGFSDEQVDAAFPNGLNPQNPPKPAPNSAQARTGKAVAGVAPKAGTTIVRVA